MPERDAADGREGAGASDSDSLRDAVDCFVREHGPPAADLLRRLAADEPSDIAPGARIGSYVLGEKIGEGGMGVVYRARQVAPIERDVAIKFIKPGMDSEAIIARFESERRTLARMHHPNIAGVLDAGTTRSGRLYFVMEYVAGASLARYLERRRPDLDTRLRLFQAICHGVQHAHQRGVMHRDLKPSNVLVVEEGESPRPVIIDFGLAKAVREDGGADASITQAGTPVGTLDYMSPEQAGSDGGAVDTRTDVYSLGVILYFMLTESLPFGDRLRALPFDEARRLLMDLDPMPPSSRRAGSSGGSDTGTRARRLRGDLDWITLKALEKDPDRRYQSAAELARDVERHLGCEPVLAGPPSASYRLMKFLRRRRGLVGSAIAAAGALTIGLAIAGRYYIEARVERTARARAGRAAEVLQSYLLRVLSTATRDGLDPEHSALADVARAQVGELGDVFSDDPASEVLVRAAFGNLLHTAGHRAEAEREYRTALRRHGAIDLDELPEWIDAAELRARLNDLVINLATLLADAGRAEELEELARPYLADASAPEALRSRLLAISARARSARGERDDAERTLRALVEKHRTELGETHVLTLERQYDLAQLLRARGAEDEAIAILERVVSIAKTERTPGRRAAIWCRSLGEALLDRKRYPEAEAALERAFEWIQALGVDHPKVQEVVSLLVRLYETWPDPTSEARLEKWRSLVATEDPKAGADG